MANNIGALGVVLALDSAKFEVGIEKAKVKAKQFADRTQDSFNTANDTLKKLNTNLIGMNKTLNFMNRTNIASWLPVNEIVRLTDTWVGMNNQLRHATSATGSFNQAQSDVISIANTSRSSLSSVATIYAKISDSQNMLKVSGTQVARITETISKSLSLYARTAEEAASAQLQLGQALGSGRLQGDEYKSLRESASGLVNELAKSMGVTRAELDQMATKGELTSERLAQAFLKMSDGIDRSFNSTNVTIGQSLNVLSNATIQLIGEFSDATGAADGVAQSILFVAKHMDTLAKAVAAAGVGYGVYTLASSKAAADTLALTRSFYVASQQLRLSTIASIGLSNGISLAATSTKNLAIALRGLLLSPVGLALGAAAGAFLLFANGGKAAKESLLDLSQPLDSISEKIKTLSVIQLDAEKIRLGKDYQEQLEKLEGAAEHFSYQVKLSTNDGTSSALDALNALAYNMKLTSEEVYVAQMKLVDGWVKNGEMSEKNAERLRESLRSYGEIRSDIEKTNAALDKVNDALNKTKSIGKVDMSVAPQGMDKWDEYLKNLENARDIIGLNARELAEYQARQKGANEEQVRIAGIVSAQTDAYKDLQEAIRRKDSAAEAAALENIKNLDIENQRMSLLAQKVIEVAKLLEMVKSGAISAKIGDQLKKTIETTYDIASQHLVQSEQSKKTINTIKANTKPDSKRATKSSGTSGGQSELQSLTKSLQEQYTVLGMTDLEAQKYKINMMQGSAAAKEYAISLAEKISRHKEEAETLKQNRALAEELSVFRDKTFLPLEMMGLGDFTREKMNDLIAVREEYAQKRRQLEENQESESTRISEEAYQARLQALIEGENQKLAIIKEGYQKRKDLESNWALGAAEALNNYAIEANNVYASMNTAVSNAFHGMEDALLDFVMTGKANFKDLANSIIRDLMRIFIQQQITGVFASAIGGLFGGNSHMTFASSGSVAASVGALTPLKIATGGLVTGPGTATSDSIPAMLSNGEYVINAKATKQYFSLLEAINSSRVPVYRSMGGVVGAAPRMPTVPSLQGNTGTSGGVVVNITNQSSQSVGGNAKMSTDSMGNAVIDVMLFDLNSNGRYAQQLKSVIGR